jgi:VWFA-related protein
VSRPRLISNMRVVSPLLMAVVCLMASYALSQQDKQSQKSQDEVITLKAHLVTLDVMVKDKKGKYITDLKSEDFTLFENGVRQKIEFFDPPIAAGSKSAQPESVGPDARPMNIISLVLDRQTTELANLKQVREGTLKYIREQIADTDTVALFAVTNGLQLLQPFTQDKAKLISAVENAYSVSASSKNLEIAGVAEEIARKREELSGAGETKLPQSSSATSQGSAAARAMIASRVLQQFIKLRAQLSLQQSRPILAALAAICEAQRGIPGKKTLVLFSQGFITSSTLDWQVQSTVDIANRANVAIYIIDSSGLTAGAPRSGASIPSSPLEGVSATAGTEDRMRTVGGENVFDHVRHEGVSREQDILYRISGDTGGQFIKGTNDIAKGLDRIDQEIRSRYTLAYYSADQNYDGSFRKLKVEVTRPGLSVISRSGFYAIAGEELTLFSPDDRKLLADFASAESSPALPLFVEMSRFRTHEGHYIVPLSIEVPPTAVKFNQKGDKRQMQLDVLGVIKRTEGKIISRLGGSFDVAMDAAQYQSVINNKIFYRQDMELAPGAYTIELIVRDRLSGKTAARREELVLPDPDREFSASGVVLSRMALPAAADATDVLSQGGVQVRPSPSREFQPTDNLIIFFELYNAAPRAEMGKPLVSVTVTIMKDDKAAMRPIDYVLTETEAVPAPHLTFAKYISLASLPAGKYVAVIEARDMVTRRLVKQHEPFVVTK